MTLLTICGNGLSDYCGDEGAVVLASVLANCAVRHLNMALNRISSHGATVLAETCQCCSIESLNLSSNKIGDEGVLALATALRNSSLSSLTFKDNRGAVSIGAEVELLKATVKLG